MESARYEGSHSYITKHVVCYETTGFLADNGKRGAIKVLQTDITIDTAEIFD